MKRDIAKTLWDVGMSIIYSELKSIKRLPSIQILPNDKITILGGEFMDAELNIGCDYCTDIHHARDCVLPDGTERMLVVYPNGTFLGKPFIYERKIKFCPMCGKEINHIKG